MNNSSITPDNWLLARNLDAENHSPLSLETELKHVAARYELEAYTHGIADGIKGFYKYKSIDINSVSKEELIALIASEYDSVMKKWRDKVCPAAKGLSSEYDKNEPTAFIPCDAFLAYVLKYTKSISFRRIDEILSKIHDTRPCYCILWDNTSVLEAATNYPNLIYYERGTNCVSRRDDDHYDATYVENAFHEDGQLRFAEEVAKDLDTILTDYFKRYNQMPEESRAERKSSKV
jgi:hypothetical protein